MHDAELTQQIIVIHERSRGTYGAPHIHAVLKRDGAGCGRRRATRLTGRRSAVREAPGR
ncbi:MULTISPECIES: IS3 family transposase [unclassified Streptomyces]|uniref:IS3 family transposase n=1 Tax=unclassified Streptomyces TaxID=2593676 RepID=UPI0033C612ED